MKIKIFGVNHTGTREQFRNIVQSIENGSLRFPELSKQKHAIYVYEIQRALDRNDSVLIGITWFGIIIGWILIWTLVPYHTGIAQMSLSCGWFLLCTKVYKWLLK